MDAALLSDDTHHRAESNVKSMVLAFAVIDVLILTSTFGSAIWGGSLLALAVVVAFSWDLAWAAVLLCRMLSQQPIRWGALAYIALVNKWSNVVSLLILSAQRIHDAGESASLLVVAVVYTILRAVKVNKLVQLEWCLRSGEADDYTELRQVFAQKPRFEDLLKKTVKACLVIWFLTAAYVIVRETFHTLQSTSQPELARLPMQAEPIRLDACKVAGAGGTAGGASAGAAAGAVVGAEFMGPLAFVGATIGAFIGVLAAC